MLGILGVGSGILASLAAVGFPTPVLTQFAGVATVGGLLGAIIGRRVTATELPQTVALLHSIVGLSAVLTSIGSVLQELAHASTLHLTTAYLGVVIGLCSFTCVLIG
jgi:NAD(P) transhydrogenase